MRNSPFCVGMTAVNQTREPLSLVSAHQSHNGWAVRSYVIKERVRRAPPPPGHHLLTSIKGSHAGKSNMYFENYELDMKAPSHIRYLFHLFI